MCVSCGFHIGAIITGKWYAHLFYPTLPLIGNVYVTQFLYVSGQILNVLHMRFSTHAHKTNTISVKLRARVCIVTPMYEYLSHIGKFHTGVKVTDKGGIMTHSFRYCGQHPRILFGWVLFSFLDPFSWKWE